MIYKKRVLAMVLAIVMIICIFPITSGAASYTSDYKNWSQGASDNSKMRLYGCWVVSQAKMIAETGINNSSSFNPDVYMNWQFDNGYLNSGFYQTNGGYAPVAYAQSVGNYNLQYLGVVTAGTTDKIWNNINQGYYSILKVRTSSGGTHYCMIANALSSANGTLYMYDTWSQSANYGPRKLSYTVTAVYTYSYAGGASSSGSSVSSPSYANIAESNYNIINKSSGKYLNAFAYPGQAKSGNTNICASDADNSAEQKFKIESIGNNKYLIRSLSNSNLFCVDIQTSSTNPASGTNVYLYSNTDFASKHWYFEDIGSGYYVIRSVLNPNLVLTAVSNAARANVCVKSYSGSDLQKWQLVNLSSSNVVTTPPSTNASTVSESNFHIISKSSGNYLNAYAMAGQATSSNVTFGTGSMKGGIGTDVCISNADNSMEQVWKLEKHNGSNQYYIRSCSNTGYYCVNAWSPHNYVDDGADVRLYNYNTTSSKHWTFEDAGDGYYIIRNVMNSNLVLTAVDNTHRADVVVKSYSGYDNQKWKLVDLNPSSTPVVQNAFLDLNCYYDGSIKYDLGDIATADVYINGTLVADDVNDFNTQYPEGTKYEISDIKAKNGYSYVGVHSGSVTGTIGSSTVEVYLKFEKTSDDFSSSEIDTSNAYSLVNKSAGTYLNAYAKDSAVKATTNVCASNSDGSNEQKFKLQPVGDGKYLIRSLSNANFYCVDVYTPANVAEDGANVWMYHNTDFASKHWYFESVGDNYYVIRNALNTNLVLTAVDNNHRANVVVKTYTGSDLQKWKLTTLDETSSSNESATQNENIQKLNDVLRKWVNVGCTFDLNVSTSKTQVIDYNNPPVTMDCSSFSSSIYLTVFGVDIGRNTRVQQFRGAPVGINKAKNQDYSDLQIGDLILFDWGKDGVPDHVGIYSGNGNYIHMTTYNKVMENSFTYKNRYENILTIRRIIQQDGSLYPWPYTSQGDDEVTIFASAAVINNVISYSFDKDEQTITNIPADCTYGEILLNTNYDKIVVLNSNGGNLITITRDELTTGEFVTNDAVVLNGTIANFYDAQGNLVFVGECIVDGELDMTLYGDVNGDGEIDVMDILDTVKYINGVSGVEIDMAASDASKDGTIDVLDVLNIVKYLNGFDITLG